MDYSKMSVKDLRAECKARQIAGYSKLLKGELVSALEASESAEVKPSQPVGVSQAPQVREPFRKYRSKADRNKAKAYRRSLRARGFPAGF